MLEPHKIKKEKSNTPSDDVQNCIICKSETKERVGNSNNVREVLVNFGLNRKKVFTLSREGDNLYERFKKFILGEPAFSDLLEDSYLVFQEFCEKFGMWVDVEVNETPKDGAVLNAVFFPNKIELDESNPGSIRKKEILIVKEKLTRKRPCGSEIIHIDLADDDLFDNSVNKSEKVQSPELITEEQNMEEGEEKVKKSFTNNAKMARISKVNIEESKKVEGKNKKKCQKNKELLKFENLSEENVRNTVYSKLKTNIKTKVTKEECIKKKKKSMNKGRVMAEKSSQKGNESKSENQQKMSKSNGNCYHKTDG